MTLSCSKAGIIAVMSKITPASKSDATPSVRNLCMIQDSSKKSEGPLFCSRGAWDIAG